MKFSKILLILGIIALLSAFAMSTSFAISSEKITKYKLYSNSTYNKKIVTIDELSISNHNDNVKLKYYNINIKKKYQNKYKLKSVNITYTYHKENWESVKVHKNYNAKNKNTIKIKGSPKYYYVDITINYYTKSKIKKESISLPYNSHKWKGTFYYYGKKSNIKLYEAKNITETQYLTAVDITYEKFKVTTKNKKYKIKEVKVVYYDFYGVNSIKTYKGHGKNSLTIEPKFPKKLGIFGGLGEFIIVYY
ncbi:hypothetical protein MBCUT_16740 [Methanobrevibacter cuticularis]|uniref:Uncharacterized protein n=1 Tax=Methanobrevibacter cuticularis TaxID=47311 RepID=A0A166D510_9EURY|nr:hypothetical protein [Methanobrevibacter cuticularis]KZX15214.1 hypothetical protein MBCUT_16740 [Methanobrevibacter cuticularis]